MKAFPHPNLSNNWQCPVCNTNKDCPVVLVGIPGTEDGGVMEAKQVHEECYKLIERMNESD